MKRAVSILVICILISTVAVSGCFSSASCPNCGSSDVEDVGAYTDPISGDEMQGYTCNVCGTPFGVRK